MAQAVVDEMVVEDKVAMVEEVAMEAVMAMVAGAGRRWQKICFRNARLHSMKLGMAGQIRREIGTAMM